VLRGLRQFDVGDCSLHVHRNVDVHRAGAARDGLLERPAEYPRQSLDVVRDEALFRDRLQDAREVARFLSFDLLEYPFTVLVGLGCTREHDHRDGVDVRRRDARHRVGRAGADRGEHGQGLPACPCVPISQVRGTLLVARLDDVDVRLVERIEEIRTSVTGNPDQVLYTFLFEILRDNLATV